MRAIQVLSPIHRQRTRKTKGISSILGTVIVLAITIALGALLYGYANGMFSNMSQNSNVNAQVSLIVNPSTGGAYLQYSLQNNGNIKVTIYSITVNGGGNILANNITLLPGDSYQNVSTLTTGTTTGVSFQPGSYYTVIIYGVTATHKAITIAQNVLASETS